MAQVLILSAPPGALPWLRQHPGVSLPDRVSASASLRFRQGAWDREVVVGDPMVQPGGLVELMDNNPMVCADRVSVPDPWSTFALLAFGPLARASLLPEPPVMLTSLEEVEDPDVAGTWLGLTGGPTEMALQSEPADLGRVAVATGFAVIPTPARLDDLDDLYEEAYGRSFFVREAAEDDQWNPDAVAGTPMAYFRLAVAHTDEPKCLLRVQLIADRDGKLGGAQLVHAMNVMVGFEESLGLEASVVP